MHKYIRRSYAICLYSFYFGIWSVMSRWNLRWTICSLMNESAKKSVDVGGHAN